MISDNLGSRLVTACKVLHDAGWIDEYWAVCAAIKRIEDFEEFAKMVILRTDYMPGKMRDKLEQIADDAQEILYEVDEHDNR